MRVGEEVRERERERHRQRERVYNNMVVCNECHVLQKSNSPTQYMYI